MSEVESARDLSTGPDGTSFVMIRSEKESTASAIHVVLNWFEELKELAGSP